MDLSEIIDRAQNFISDASVAEQAGDLKKAYDQLDDLHVLLTAELLPMERPE